MEGFVASVDRGRYGVLVDDRTVTAMRARELGRRGVVVGDQVALAGDTSGGPGTLARVVRVAPRTTALRRSADDTDPVERVIVANADQMVIVCSVADPPPRPRFIDRCLVAAYDAGLRPLLCLTKADLADPGPFAAHYAELELPVLITRRDEPERLGALADALAGRVSALVGHSGVGKSTLVNALLPDADLAVGTVSPVTGRGRHTSSSAVAWRCPRAAGSSTRPGCAGSGSATSPRTGWCARSPTCFPARPRARPAAITTSPTARSTTGCAIRAATRAWWPGWIRCGGCCAAATAPSRGSDAAAKAP